MFVGGFLKHLENGLVSSIMKVMETTPRNVDGCFVVDFIKRINMEIK